MPMTELSSSLRSPFRASVSTSVVFARAQAPNWNFRETVTGAFLRQQLLHGPEHATTNELDRFAQEYDRPAATASHSQIFGAEPIDT